MKRIEDYLKYDETSKTYLRWITRYGNEAFTTVYKNRYYKGQFNHKHLSAHQVIMYLFYGKWSSRELQIDHIDANPLNNKIDNLRFVTPIENQRNLNNKVPKNNTTGIRGLCQKNFNGRMIWRARLFGKTLYRGLNKHIAIKRLEKAKRDYIYSKQENQLKLQL